MDGKDAKTRFDSDAMEMSDLIRKINEGRLEINNEFKETLSKLKEALNLVEEVTNQSLRYAKINPEDLSSIPLSAKDLKRLERTRNIKKEAELLGIACEEVKKKRRLEQVDRSEESVKRGRKKRERRKLFKSLGADDTWIPL